MQRSFWIVLLIVPLVFFLSRCAQNSEDENHSSNDRFSQFAGSASCAGCHHNIHQDFIHTAHDLDSRPASISFIKGSFDSGRNQLVYHNGASVIMERDSNRFFQSEWLQGRLLRREPFGVVIGSGRKGQTYLYWSGDRLFQLPVSFFTPTDSWCNSPGFPTDSALFSRPVVSFCLECHTTYAQTVFSKDSSDKGNRFDSSRILFGIGCEKCHGPGAEHVAFQQAHPDVKTARFIINPKSFSRQQKLDLCALCHSGRRIPLRPAFNFQSGDRLDDFSEPGFLPETVSLLDVHANQYGLLTSSKCFRSSQMDCSTCHNPHRTEVGNPQLFSQRCMSCHQQAYRHACTMKASPGLVLSDNCIDCHMPAMPSKNIVLQLTGTKEDIYNLVRTHRIAVYPDYTKAFLDKLKSKKKSGG